MKLIPVILSGGSGTRLWPVSRALYPKQLLALLGNESLLQQTVLRAKTVAPDSPQIMICNHEHRFQVAEQIRTSGLDDTHIILEPIGRNTAPAIAIAAMQALKIADDPILLVMPSDHLINNIDAFKQAVQTGLPLAAKDALVTFGVKPDKPASSYGYIHAVNEGISVVDQFTEKPSEAVAKEYIRSGNYYWNSGMFLFRAQSYLAALEKHAPEILSACQEAYSNIRQEFEFLRLPEKEFASCPGNSIDYAVMEHTNNAMVVPMDAGWSDLGSWRSLWETGDKDEQSNVVSGDVLLQDSNGCYVRSEFGLIGLLGVKDHIVIGTADAVLVAHKDRAEDIKALVDELKASGRQEVNLHRRVFRPWGSYETLDEASRFKVKRITVKPGASLSLQKHRHRAEHWIVVKGTARVTCGEKQYIIGENESTYIPLGAQHRLENPGAFDLELIEVQSGSYLGEDDIVRLQDNYGR
ncbi:MAG: mannose-1-phosphate guanylyltransferase/mannose-6-phosphate isomerase [Gammaproteobacteria bacterium]|nr:mannose-1-phosphate guanylyltransferase/mannose-6-phosphate isomerase [Gammaproteobacteria bacterium]